MGFERSGDKITDSGMKKIADILHNPNDELIVILLDIEEKDTKDGTKKYNIYHLFEMNQGDIAVTSFGSNLDRVCDEAIKKSLIVPRKLPCLYLGLESVSNSINQRTGEPQQWHNVYIEPIKESADVVSLRNRAKAETKVILEGQPYAPAMAAARPQSSFDDAMNSAINDDSETIPF